MYFALPAASWSRLRSSATPGQLPLRSRAEHLGMSSLNPHQMVCTSVSTLQCSSRGFVTYLPGGLRPCSRWARIAVEFQELVNACGVKLPTRFDRPAAPGRDSHESADTPEQALSTLAHPGKMERRIILPRPTSRVMFVRSSACSVQGNGRRGAFLSSSS